MARESRSRSAEPEVKKRRKPADDEAPAKRSRSRSTEEAPAKRSRSKSADEAPKRSRSKKEEEAPPKRSRSKAAAEDKPKRSRSRAEADDEAPKRSRKSSAEKAPPRSRKKADVEEAPAKRSRSKKGDDDGEAVKKPSGFNPYANIDTTLDNIEKHIGLTDSGMSSGERRMSTGLLMNDIVLGGGVTAGWYTNFGQEQTCKTTNAVTMLISAINTDVPIIGYWDFEGSATPEYIENIMRNMGVKADVKSIFGVKNKDGSWAIPPRVRYRSEAVAEKFFDYLAQIERKLPDKKKIGDEWYYIYEGKHLVKGKMTIHKANAAIVGDHYDKDYYRKTGNYRIPAPDGSLQAVVLVDSYPAMLPERLDVDDPNSSVGAQARMFSEQLKRVKGKMRAKRVAVLGINQLRLKPMVMMGNPEYETGGEALKLFSDVRLKHTSRALSAISKVIGETVKGEGQIEEEPSIHYKHGVDNYRYINVRAHKNKLSRPYLEAWLRLWITDGKGNAQGFDPVFDTWMYLRSTGQLEGSRKKMTLLFKGNEATKSIGWLDFKRLIIGDRADAKGIYQAIGMKPCNLREKCFAQVSSGKGIDLFNENEINKRGRKSEKAEKSGKSAPAEGEDDND